MNTQCKSCGGEIAAQGKFCPNCGTKVPEPVPGEPLSSLVGDVGYNEGNITQDNSQHDNSRHDASRHGASIGGGVQFVIGGAGGLGQSPSLPLLPCPVCGRKNEEKNTFRCRHCGRDFICLDHQDPEHFVCIHCVKEIKTKTAPPTAPQPADPQVVLCPVCGRRNALLETFLCHNCGRDHLCLAHQDETLTICCDCLSKQNSSSPEAITVDKKIEHQNELPAAEKQRPRSPAEQRNIDFWTELLARAASKTQLHAHISPSKGPWIATAAGLPGVFLQYRVWKNRAGVELYIDAGSKNKELNHATFDRFFAHKNDIESKFGEPLIWDKKEDRAGCMIRSMGSYGGFGARESWPWVQDDMINRMIRLEGAVADVLDSTVDKGSIATDLPSPAEVIPEKIMPDNQKNPSVDQKKSRVTSSEQRNLDFWTQLLARAKDKTDIHANISPSKGPWVAAAAGQRGVFFQYRIWKNKAGVEIYIDAGSKNKALNHATYERFYARKEDIEKKFGEALLWDRKENRSGCMIRSLGTVGGFEDQDNWTEVQDDMINRMIRLEGAVADVLHSF